MMGLVIVLLHIGIFGIVLANLRYLRRTSQATPLITYPRLSVLVPARNEKVNLSRLLPTVLDQDYPDFEVIVYDDGSEDGTAEVLESFDEPRLRTLRGEGPPPGWLGKPHALYQATRIANGDLYLFLDADASLLRTNALRSLIEMDAAQPHDAVMTGFVRLDGGGLLLVSLVSNTILGGLPWPLVRRLGWRSLGAINGQCWLIEAALYHRLEPHQKVKNKILEDVEIGRYLMDEGYVPTLCDIRREVVVHMYVDHADAWQGFRKNAYLLAGGTPVSFALLYVFYLLTFTLCWLVSPWLLASLYLIKAVTDHFGRFSLRVTLAAPISYLLGSILQLDSAVSHWTRRVAWKGRDVQTNDAASSS